MAVSVCVSARPSVAVRGLANARSGPGPSGGMGDPTAFDVEPSGRGPLPSRASAGLLPSRVARGRRYTCRRREWTSAWTPRLEAPAPFLRAAGTRGGRRRPVGVGGAGVDWYLTREDERTRKGRRPSPGGSPDRPDPAHRFRPRRLASRLSPTVPRGLRSGRRGECALQWKRERPRGRHDGDDTQPAAPESVTVVVAAVA